MAIPSQILQKFVDGTSILNSTSFCQEQTDTGHGGDLDRCRNGTKKGGSYARKGEDQKKNAFDKDRCQRDSPVDTHRAYDTEGKVGVESHGSTHWCLALAIETAGPAFALAIVRNFLSGASETFSLFEASITNGTRR